MGAWRSIRHRLDDAARSSSTVAGVTYIGRTWRASPSEGYPTAHQIEQDRIVRAALGVAPRPDQRLRRAVATAAAAAATLGPCVAPPPHLGPWARAASSSSRRCAGVSLRHRP